MLFFFQAEDGIRDYKVTGVQTCALPIWLRSASSSLSSCRSLSVNSGQCSVFSEKPEPQPLTADHRQLITVHCSLTTVFNAPRGRCASSARNPSVLPTEACRVRVYHLQVVQRPAVHRWLRGGAARSRSPAAWPKSPAAEQIPSSANPWRDCDCRRAQN